LALNNFAQEILIVFLLPSDFLPPESCFFSYVFPRTRHACGRARRHGQPEPGRDQDHHGCRRQLVRADCRRDRIDGRCRELVGRLDRVAHPYGHGKAESIAGVIAALGLLAAAGIIAAQSIHEILQPHEAPAWYTLVVLLVVIAVKEFLARRVLQAGDALESTSLRVDAWHHRSDALTSAAVALGIAVALWGGPGYEAADDWAALVACAVIAVNGLILLRFAVREIMDETVSAATQEQIRLVAGNVHGVQAIEKVRVRKSGVGLYMDIHVQVDGEMTVRESHAIGHRVKDALLASGLRIEDVVVHIEPLDDDD
jgi:cation diffusion facilitator family transporter